MAIIVEGLGIVERGLGEKRKGGGDGAGEERRRIHRRMKLSIRIQSLR